MRQFTRVVVFVRLHLLLSSGDDVGVAVECMSSDDVVLHQRCETLLSGLAE